MQPHDKRQADAQSAPKGGVDLDKLRERVSPVLVAQGIELVELEWLTERVGWTLRVTIEREGAKDAGGGVTLEDCVEVSRDVSQVLDVEDLIPAHYHLEVTSPGLDRKLRGPADFVRFRGQVAKVKLSVPAPDGQRVLRGALEEAPEGRVAVFVDGKRIEVPFADVEEARLVFELKTGEKKGKPKGKARPGRAPGGDASKNKEGGAARR